MFNNVKEHANASNVPSSPRSTTNPAARARAHTHIHTQEAKPSEDGPGEIKIIDFGFSKVYCRP